MIIKKLILCLSFFTCPLVHAGIVPQWLSEWCPEMNTKNTVFIGLSAIGITSIGLYLWHNNYQNSLSHEFVFKNWNKHFKQLSRHPMEKTQTILTKKMLEMSLNKYFATFKKNYFLNNQENWVNSQRPEKLLKSVGRNQSFDPYLQKFSFPPGSLIAFYGDIHGDIRSLNDYLAYLEELEYLQNMKIVKKDFHMLFLGDYVDRGLYGPEVIQLILQLQTANPDNVILVRGNHEDIALNKNDNYGFFNQLTDRFKNNSTNMMQKIQRMYETLPLGVFIGCNGKFALCCHGGIEPGFTSHDLIDHPNARVNGCLGKLNRAETFAEYLKKHPKYKQSADYKSRIQEEFFIESFADFYPTDITTLIFGKCYLSLGFQWNDFALKNNHIYQVRGSSFSCGRKFTKFMLKKMSTNNNKVRIVIRGHQHSDNDMVECILNTDNHDHACNTGIGKAFYRKDPKSLPPQRLQKFSVCTLSVCPNGGYKNKGFKNTFGLLTLAEKFKDWRLEVREIPSSTDD